MSIYKRKSGRYEVRIDIDPTAAGLRRRRSLGTFTTKKEAEKAERSALEAKDRGIDLAPQNVLFSQIVERFLSDARIRVGAKTLERYEDIAKRNILAHIGTITVAKLKPTHLTTLYADLLERGRANGKGGLSPRTVGHVHALIREILGWAFRMELVGRNVADVVTPPKAVKREAKSLSIEEARRLIEATGDHRFGPLIMFTLATGVRRGELVALKWGSVDLDSGRATIRSSASFAYGKVSEKEPKTGQIRTISLSPLALDALKKQKVRQAEERLAAGGAYQNNGYVFADQLGERMHPRAVTTAFTSAANRVGLSTTSFHALRHTCASLMIGSGVDPKTAASVLGHANPNITLAIYSHLIEGAQAAAVGKVAERLASAGKIA